MLFRMYCSFSLKILETFLHIIICIPVFYSMFLGTIYIIIFVKDMKNKIKMCLIQLVIFVLPDLHLNNRKIPLNGFLIIC
ncbi:hypothetical protein BDB01DRAFT_811046 [Pilobolus umbonatus]|nr:hypothetical protein BDB01DRAFT_811046 [Pilobolus umbonatus]